MSINLQGALEIVNELSVEDLQALSRDQLLYIISGLTAEEAREFMFAKNIKIFGGINGYVENFLSTGTVMKMKTMPNEIERRIGIQGALNALNKMLTYDDLTEENRTRINEAILQLTNETAPAAGGYRRKNKSRKSKSRKVNTRKSKSQRQKAKARV
jgi:predicted nucleic acid-binding OB-fold protein